MIGKSEEKLFNYKKHHTVEVCTEHFINYLLNEQICFKVYGHPDINEKEVARRASVRKRSFRKKIHNDST